jgi:hypothetical protein
LWRNSISAKNLQRKQPDDRRRWQVAVERESLTEAARFFPTIADARAQLDWRSGNIHDLSPQHREQDSKLLMQAWELDQFVITRTISRRNRDAAAPVHGCRATLARHGHDWLRERPVANQRLVSRCFPWRSAHSTRTDGRRWNAAAISNCRQVMEMLLASQDITPSWRAGQSARRRLAETAWARIVTSRRETQGANNVYAT